MSTLSIYNYEYNNIQEFCISLIVFPLMFCGAIFALYMCCKYCEPIENIEGLWHISKVRFIAALTCFIALAGCPIGMLAACVVAMFKAIINKIYPNSSKLKCVEFHDDYVQFRYDIGKFDCRYHYSEITELCIVTHYAHTDPFNEFGMGNQVSTPCFAHMFFSFNNCNNTIELTKKFDRFIDKDYEIFLKLLEPYLSKIHEVKYHSEEIHLPT